MRRSGVKHRSYGVVGIAFTLMWVPILGCRDKAGQPERVAAERDSLQAMNFAIQLGQWQQAWTFSDAVLVEHAEDADAIATVAKVAHANNKAGVAADLLADACRVESFSNERRVEQTLIAMISVGRLYGGLQLLEEAVQENPLHHYTRRLLYDTYVGSEKKNRQASLTHGRFLVRQRKFDIELLMSFGNIEHRTQDAKPLEEMTARNPADRRPLLGVARQRFNEGRILDAIKLLRSIVEKHEDFLPAQVLLGHALVSAAKLDDFEKWEASQGDGIKAFPGYWVAIGDWAKSRRQIPQATRAYAEAAQRDADSTAIWSKLSMAFKENNAGDVTDATRQAVDRRVILLSSLWQQRQRFDRTSQPSREIATEISSTLWKLGRLWEAEAWAAIATTLPNDDSVRVEEIRQSIVAELRKDTPWQKIAGRPEFQLDLTDLPIPVVSAVSQTESGMRSLRSQAHAIASSGRINLVNEARQRELTFFGYTNDDLDQPGIMLHETLGCGGATIDFDLDGWSDLYLVAAGGTPGGRNSDPNALMRNRGGVFADVTNVSGTGDLGFGQGVAMGDVNEDGFPDLLVLNYGANRLLINQGDGTFTDATEPSLPKQSENQWSASAAIADLDGDSLSDIVVVNYCAGMNPTTHKCFTGDSGLPRSCSPMVFAAEPDRFYRGGSEGVFVDHTQRWNATPEVPGRGLGIVVGSFDPASGLDVFIANDMTNNHYWSRSLSDTDFKLAESALLNGLGTDGRSLAQGSMGIATGDFDRDGDIDFYVTNFEHEYNTYHEQGARGLWQDRTLTQGLVRPTMPLVGFGTEAVDFDNNGQLELLVSNGHVDMFSRGDESSVYAQPIQLFRWDVDQLWRSVLPAMQDQYMSRPHVGRALWTIDADRDGLTDIAITHQTEPVALLMNRSEDTGSWIEFQLSGTTCSRDAVGAVLEITAGGKRWTSSLNSGDGYLCSNERIIRVGMGKSSERVDAVVKWPGGAQQQFKQLSTNTTWMIVQGDAPFEMNRISSR